MSDQHKALRLADALDDEFTQGRISNHNGRKAAAELRRLHTENELLHQRHHDDNVEYTRVLAQRDALLEALRSIAATDPVDAALDPQRAVRIARAAIEAVEEKNK